MRIVIIDEEIYDIERDKVLVSEGVSNCDPNLCPYRSICKAIQYFSEDCYFCEMDVMVLDEDNY